MATQPQPIHAAPTRAEINKQNAQHSTGPRTPEGRQRVRTNALKHGLTAKEVFLAEGESQRYERLLEMLTVMWHPVGGIEHDLVLSLRDAVWRLNSIPVTQINLTTLATEEHMEAFEHLSDDPAAQRCAAQASAYRANAKLFDQLSRHEMRLERRVRNIEADLDRLIEARIEQAGRIEAAKQTEAAGLAQQQDALRQEQEDERAQREHFQRIALEQEEQVAAYLAAKKTEATKQTQPPESNLTGSSFAASVSGADAAIVPPLAGKSK